MAFFDDYRQKIFDLVSKKRREIYNASKPDMISPGNLNKCLVKGPNHLFMSVPYIILPSRDLFVSPSERKILEEGKSHKPVVKYYTEMDSLERFVLNGNVVTVNLQDKKGKAVALKGNKDLVVSYRHFLGMLSSLDKVITDESLERYISVKP